MNPETKEGAFGSAYISVCKYEQKPKGCLASDVQTYGYFFDHKEVCFGLSSENEEVPQKTIWASGFDYEVSLPKKPNCVQRKQQGILET